MRKCMTAILLVCFMLAGIVPGVWAAEPATTDTIEQDILTLEEAVKLALDTSQELEQTDLAAEAAAITRDEVWDAANAFLMQTYIPGTDIHVSVPTDSDPTGAVYQANYAWLAKKKAYEIKAESVAYTAQQKYLAVLTALNNQEAKGLAAERDNENLRIARIKFQLGMITALDLSGIMGQNTASQAAYTSAGQTLDKAYAELDDYLGLAPGDKPVLEDKLIFSQLEVDDLDIAINAIVGDSPSVWLAEEAVRLEEQTQGLDSWELDKVNKDEALVNVKVAQETMTQAVRQLYYTTKQLEESYAVALQGLDAAERGLATSKLMYEVGLGTKADVLKAEAALSAAQGDAQTGLKNLVYQHYLLKLAFEKPWSAS